MYQQGKQHALIKLGLVTADLAFAGGHLGAGLLGSYAADPERNTSFPNLAVAATSAIPAGLMGQVGGMLATEKSFALPVLSGLGAAALGGYAGTKALNAFRNSNNSE